MLTLQEAWGNKFYPSQILPKDLAVMVVASALGLTGARSIVEAAHVSNCNRAQAQAICYFESAQYIQRQYRRHPDLVVTILGDGIASHCLITDKDGCPMSDILETCRIAYVPNVAYSYELRPEPNTVILMPVLCQINLTDAIACLSEAGYWQDTSWGYDKPRPRGGDYL